MPLIFKGPLFSQAAGSYAETGVVADGTNDYLTATTALSSSIGQMLIFASFLSSTDARQAFMVWEDSSGGMHSDYTTGNSNYGCRSYLKDNGTANIIVGNEIAALGGRLHVLWAGWHTGTAPNAYLNSKCQIWHPAANNYVEAFNNTAGPNSNAYLRLNTNPIRLFANNASAAQKFSGTVFRVGLWTSLTRAEPLIGGNGIGSVAFQNNFTSGGSIIAPATAQAALDAEGMSRQIDFYGPASRFNTPTNDGLLNFTKNGEFT